MSWSLVFQCKGKYSDTIENYDYLPLTVFSSKGFSEVTLHPVRFGLLSHVDYYTNMFQSAKWQWMEYC